MTDDLDALRFNRAVAQLYMLSNAIADAPEGRCTTARQARGDGGAGSAQRADDAASGGKCWQALGHYRLVAQTPWPKYDPALLSPTASPSRFR